MSPRQRRGRPRHDDLLTPAEWRVANAVRHGLSNRAIAEHLGVTPDAIKFHVANILGKLDLDNRRQLQRWAGAHNTSAIHNGAREMTEQLCDKWGAIAQLSRNVENLNLAEEWYRDVLGLPHLFRAGQMSFFMCGSVRLMLQQYDLPPDGYIIYFDAPDIHARVAALEAKGVTMVAAPHMVHRHADGTEEWMAFFDDCEGQKLGLLSRVGPA